MSTPARPTARDSTETRELLGRARAGDGGAVDELLTRHRAYLRHVVELNLDARLRGRVDPSDVVQEAQMEASRRLPAYLEQPPMVFRLWLRQITYDRLLMARRRHAGAQKRSVTCEVPLPERSTLQLAGQLLGADATPSEQAVQHELARRVEQAIARLSPADRDMLVMRHFEGLDNQEIAGVLQIEPATASKRYGRALLRLRTLLVEGGVTESQL